MFSPQKQQMNICVLKSNLEEIGNELVVQYSTLPILDEENAERCRETMGVIQVVRAINTETERQKKKSARLTAQRRQLQQNCEEMTKSINKALKARKEIEIQLQQVENKVEQKFRKYEALLREKADRFRKMHNFYDAVETKRQLEMINEHLIKIVTQERKQQNIAKELQTELDSIVPELPDNILVIAGKNVLEDKLKAVTDKCAELQVRRDRLQNNQKYVYNFNMQ